MRPLFQRSLALKVPDQRKLFENNYSFNASFEKRASFLKYVHTAMKLIWPEHEANIFHHSHFHGLSFMHE